MTKEDLKNLSKDLHTSKREVGLLIASSWSSHVRLMFKTKGFGTWKYTAAERKYRKKKAKAGAGKQIMRYKSGEHKDRLFKSLVKTEGKDSAFRIEGDRVSIGTNVPYAQGIMEGKKATTKGKRKRKRRGSKRKLPPRDLIHKDLFMEKIKPLIDALMKQKVVKHDSSK